MNAILCFVSVILLGLIHIRFYSPKIQKCWISAKKARYIIAWHEAGLNHYRNLQS